MSNELTTAPTLVAYNTAVDLVEIRSNPALYPRISATPQDEAVKKMIPMVYAAFLYRGQDTTAEKVRFIATALVNEILADYRFGLRSLSWVEIGMVIRNAVLGGARELYGISVATIYSALIDYAKGEGHEAAKQAHARPEPLPPVQNEEDNFPF